MKAINVGMRLYPTASITRAFIVAGFLLAIGVLAQSIPPVLTVANTGTNTLALTVSNGVSGGNYEIWTTPVLGNTTDYPWTAAAVGTPGQTNFVVPIGPYQEGFYYAFQDTNAVPLWEAADPNNPSAGILTISIDSPTNGATLN